MALIGAGIPNEDATRLHRVYDAVSKNIERENNLINFRITWAIVLSAGFLAAEGIIINYVQQHYATNWGYHLLGQAVVIVLSALATFFCFMSRRGVRAAQIQMEHVKLRYFGRVEEFDLLELPRPFGDSKGHHAGNINATVFPVTLLCLWLAFVGGQTYRLHWLTCNPPPTKDAVSSQTDFFMSWMLETIEALPSKVCVDPRKAH